MASCAAECLPGLSAEQRTQVYYYAIYPNLLLSLHPDYMMVHTLRARKRPIAHEVVCEWHVHPNEMAKPDFQCSDAIDFWDPDQSARIGGISELSQKGISSRAYKPGPYSTREALLHAFDGNGPGSAKPNQNATDAEALSGTGKTLC